MAALIGLIPVPVLGSTTKVPSFDVDTGVRSDRVPSGVVEPERSDILVASSTKVRFRA